MSTVGTAEGNSQFPKEDWNLQKIKKRKRKEEEKKTKSEESLQNHERHPGGKS